MNLPYIDSRLLVCFLVAAETNSFQKAGARLGKSKSTVSRWIGELETLLGYELFDRQSNGLVLVLNDRGKSLQPKVRLLIDAQTRLESFIFSQGENSCPPQISLCLNQLVSNEFIAELIAAVKVKWPETGIDLSQCLPEEIDTLLTQRTTDFVLSFVPGEHHSGLGGKRVGEEQMLLVVHPDHPLTDVDCIGTRELVAQTLILPNSLKPIDSSKEEPIAMETIWTPDFQLGLDLARHKLGIAYLPEHIARPSILKKEVVSLNFDWQELDQQQPLMLLYRTDYAYPEVTQTLLIALREWFGYQAL
ncbi:LysR family transcriptional regulator [Vibrio ulleungensis]|uniref:LysR family transcriptional regulator n=1 Tax=Vibrio ulleungensis TaxID=2807619 RepID=A0ABS2HHA2_9VIBR|nr:LysR family transcriptional regulator [Vibrio ulleungensis]MBM7036051.1 LysR family transcriptional regulator [Vibrio ulleungensis]